MRRASSSSASSLDTLERSAASWRSCDLHSFSAADRSCFWLFSRTSIFRRRPSHSVRSSFSPLEAASSSEPKSSSGASSADCLRRRFSSAGRTRCARSASSLWTIEVPSPTRPSAMSFSAAFLLNGPVRFPCESSRYQTMSSSSRDWAGIQLDLSGDISFPGWTRPCSAQRRKALVGTGPKTTPLDILRNQVLVSFSSSVMVRILPKMKVFGLYQFGLKTAADTDTILKVVFDDSTSRQGLRHRAGLALYI